MMVHVYIMNGMGLLVGPLDWSFRVVDGVCAHCLKRLSLQL